MKKVRLFLVIQILFIIFPLLLYGHSRDPKFEQISVERGLSHIAVHSIIQDSQGFIWIGTSDGLNRYDGYKFLKFYSDESDNNTLSNNKIIAICEQYGENLWILSGDTVLNQFDKNTHQVNRFSLKTDESSVFYTMVIDDQDKLWFATSTGIYIFNLKTHTISKLSPGAHQNQFINNLDIRSIIIDSSGKIWLGTAGDGVFQYDVSTNIFSNIFYDNSDPTHADTVYNLLEDSFGNIWFGTNRGLIKFNSENFSHKRYRRNIYNDHTLSSDIVYSICEDLSRTSRFLWLGTQGGGINLFDVEHETVHRHTCESNTLCCLGSNIINTIYKDRSGIVWFGTDCCGLNKFLGRDIQFENIESRINIPGGWGHSPVWAFHEDKSGNVWLATSNGLKKLDRTKRKLVHFDHDKDNPRSLSNNVVTALQEDANDMLWIGTEYGLNRFNVGQNKFDKFLHSSYDEVSLSDNGIVCLMQDRLNNIWIGTRLGGVDKFNIQTGSFTHYGGHLGDPGRIIKTAVLDILETDIQYGNSIWIATYNDGLIELDQNKNELRKYEHDSANPQSISHNSISALLEDSHGNLWIGTTGGGLNCFYRKQNVFRHFTEKDGLPDKTIFALVSDDKNKIWISTARGISRFDPVSEVFRNYSLGMSSNTARLEYGILYRNSEGWLYYSTYGGILTFNPDNMRVESIIPPVTITDFKLTNDESFHYKNNYESNIIFLDYDQNFFTFEFAVLDYIDSDKNQYSYKLDGIDRDWTYSGNRNYASYTDVRPGTYTFQVKGSNSDGVWNQTGATITVIINPPPWLTWWAYSLYFIVFLSVFILINRILVKRDRLKNLARIKEFEARKLEEINEMKTRFFTNISHEIRTPLTLILGPLKKIIEKTRNKESRMYLDIMFRNANTLHSLIDQLLDHSKIETGLMHLKTTQLDLISLIKKHIMSYIPLAESQDKKLEIDTDLSSVEMFIDTEKVHKILANLISNAVKFSNKHVTIGIKKARPHKVRIGSSNDYLPNADYICISISDDGYGIEAHEIDKIFDRFYVARKPENIENSGTGIGLSLAKDLVELHHGFIDVESHVGEGSTFYVYLPLGSEHLQPQEIEQKSPLQTENIFPDTDQHSKEKGEILQTDTSGIEYSEELMVLLVEDNHEMILYLRSIFDGKYHLIDALNGADAYKKAVSQIPDLIISDIMMPGTDGLYLVQKIKTDERTSHIPVILLTAKASMQTKLDGLHLGADDYIVKPFEEKELVARVENLIEQRQKLRRHFSDKPTNQFFHNVPTKLDEKFLQRLYELVTENISESDLTVEYFAGLMHMSRVQLHRKLRAITGNSPSEYIRKIRLHTAANMLAMRSGSVYEIAYRVGFNNLSYFAKCFKEEYGIAPSDYVRGLVDLKP